MKNTRQMTALWAQDVRGRSPRFLLSALSVWVLALSVHAGEIFSGRLYTVPEKVFVNQAFEIHFELEVTSGCEAQDLRISDFPNDPKLITVGRLESASRNRITRNNRPLDVLHFKATARCHTPVTRTFTPNVQCMLVERKTSGFFSHWQSYPAQCRLQPFPLRVLPLPTTGQPDSFSGAIGTFRLTGRISQNTVRPGDIITLALELVGQGWMSDAAMPKPPASPHVKAYPPKETLREPLRVVTEQVLIPTDTNATEIASVRFAFFNPATERYEETVAGPFHLNFTHASAPATEEVRVISTEGVPASDTSNGMFIVKRADRTLRQAMPLITVCLSGVIGLLLFFMLYGRHILIAVLAGLTALALGAAAGYSLSNKVTAETRTLATRAEARFAPSPSSAILFSLNPGSHVIPLENAGAWARIDASGRRGWIPVAAIKDEPRSPNTR